MVKTMNCHFKAEGIHNDFRLLHWVAEVFLPTKLFHSHVPSTKQYVFDRISCNRPTQSNEDKGEQYRVLQIFKKNNYEYLGSVVVI